MKLVLCPLALVFTLLAAAWCGPADTVAAARPTARPAAVLTAFDEGRADGESYRVSVERAPNGNGLITQQVQAAQSAAAANPSVALYFQGYITGLQANRELTTSVQPRP